MSSSITNHETLRYQQNEAGYFVRGEAGAAAMAHTGENDGPLHQQGVDALRSSRRKDARMHRARRVIHHNRRR